MRPKLLLFSLLVCCALVSRAQFSASLSGYPLVTTGWNIGGFGTVVDSTIRLTSASTTQNGYVYYGTPVNLTACAQFTVKFDFKIVTSPASSVADGIAFWYISNPPSGFITGGGIGLPSNPNGLILIMDTYDNAPPVNVPLETLLGYDGTIAQYVEGSSAGVIAPVVPNQFFITDGTWHHCELVYNAGNVFVYYNYSTTPSLTGSYPMSINGYFGFSASTGAAYSSQYVKNIHIDAAGISAPPTVTSPVTYCQYATATPLTATGSTGSTLHWFTTDTATVVSLPTAPTPNTSVPGTTTYYVRQGNGACISAPDSIKVIVNASPAAPVIHGDTLYCANDPFVPFTITGATGTVNWYNVPVGGTPSATAPFVITGAPGVYQYWASQTVAGCEGQRDSIKVHVKKQPPAPGITGTLAYCQYIGPYVPPAVVTTISGTALWYTTATGGTSSTATPTVNVNVAGASNYWVSQVDSGCESPRTPVTITVHPKPAPPTVTPVSYCQFAGTYPLTAGGTNLTWYGPGVTTGMSAAPLPNTSAVGIINYYVTQASSFGCVSDSATLAVSTVVQPPPPAVTDTFFCQYSAPPALTATGSNIKWYTSLSSAVLPAAPVPPTTATGISVWFATQTVSGCESIRTPMNVEIIYTPQYTISTPRAWVCLHDSLALQYDAAGPALVDPGFIWNLPDGASVANGTNVLDSDIVVKFDHPGDRQVDLIVSDRHGKCKNVVPLNIHVVDQPKAVPFSNPRLCLGDTVDLSLSYASTNAATFAWSVDGVPISSSPALSFVAHTSNGGGPFSVSWNDTGVHIINVFSYTTEGCKSEPWADTVRVRSLPDANFDIHTRTGSPCLQDSIYVEAHEKGYDYNYTWLPQIGFLNTNAPTAWGLILETRAAISLTINDAFGCSNTTTQYVQAGECCIVSFPTAFTPNGDRHNDYFEPIFLGYHKFHSFRVANRWGQVVFESADSYPRWDGTLNGEPQDMGTYYYFITFDCGNETHHTKGEVTLIR